MVNSESKISKKWNTDERGTERHTDTLAGVEWQMITVLAWFQG